MPLILSIIALMANLHFGGFFQPSVSVPLGSTTPTATDITVGDIAIWSGLPDGQTHTIAVYRGTGLRGAAPFVVQYGTYMHTDDVDVPLTSNGDGSWSGTIDDVGTVTVSWNGQLVHVVVSAGRVQTEREYLCI